MSMSNGQVQACTYLQRKEAGKQDLVSRDKVPLYLIPSAVGRNEVGEFLFHVGKFIVEMVLVPELSHFPGDFKHILKDIPLLVVSALSKTHDIMGSISNFSCIVCAGTPRILSGIEFGRS